MQIDVTNAVDRNRYEIRADGRLVGIADYRVSGSSVIFPHTEIDPAMRGQGLAADLVHAALEDVRRSGRTIVPHCWYVAEYVQAHPEYSDLVAP